MTIRTVHDAIEKGQSSIGVGTSSLEEFESGGQGGLAEREVPLDSRGGVGDIARGQTVRDIVGEEL